MLSARMDTDAIPDTEHTECAPPATFPRTGALFTVNKKDAIKSGKRPVDDSNKLSLWTDKCQLITVSFVYFLTTDNIAGGS